MKRDLEKLANTEYDVLVVGGGIYGVSTAWDATLRGLRVALIDQGDFAGGTSSNSLKTIHGGLRYLQQLDFQRMRQSIHERMVLMKIAPHLVSPLAVVMPTYGYSLKSRPAMFLALLANDVIGFDRNRLSDPDKLLPGGHLISRKELMEYIPGYQKDSMSGGALWYDCQCHNTERMALLYALSAAERGADLANYVACSGFLRQKNRVTGIKATDVFAGDTFDIRARMVVNTGGPWIDEINGKINDGNNKNLFMHSTAMNIIVKKKLLNGCAAGLPVRYQYRREDGSLYRGSQILFFAPWRDHTIIGTRHFPYYGNPSDYRVKESEIQEIVSSVNKAYPAASVAREDVSFFHGGLLPMSGVASDSGEVKLTKHYKIYDHAAEDNLDGLITVMGVKYTTHRYVAGKTVDMIFKKSGRTPPECTTGKVPLYGGEIERVADFLDSALHENKLVNTVIRHLVFHYGSRYRDILEYTKEDPALAQTVPGSHEVLKAEIVNSVRNEMAMRLSDVILRRTDLGSACNPGEQVLHNVAGIMGKELGWDEARISSEVNDVASGYVPVN